MRVAFESVNMLPWLLIYPTGDLPTNINLFSVDSSGENTDHEKKICAHQKW